MKQIQNFRFNDVILYAKCWYEHSSDVFQDLESIIKLNNHYTYPEHMTHKDVSRYMLKALDLIYDHLDPEDKRNGCWYYSHAAFLDELNHRMSLYDLDQDQAIISIILGIMSILRNDQIKLIPPLYAKGRPRMGSLCTHYPISMTYTEMNRHAYKMFGHHSISEAMELRFYEFNEYYKKPKINNQWKLKSVTK